MADVGSPDRRGADEATGRGVETEQAPDANRVHHPAMFVDSSAIVALVDRDDASHAAAVAAYQELVAADYKFLTTNYAVAETFELLQAGLGPDVARQWLRDSQLAVYHADEQDLAKARRMILRAGTRRLSLTDAVGIVVMERLGVSDAFAVAPDLLAESE